MIQSQEFRQRRAALTAVYPKAVVVLTAHDAVQKDRDSSVFQQEANFLYATGIDEPGWVLVLSQDYEFLIAPVISDQQELFDGSLDWHEAIRISGVTEIVGRREGNRRLRLLARQYAAAATLLPDPHQKYYGFIPNPAPARLEKKMSRLFSSLHDVRPTLARMRAIKSPAEIALIEQAIAVTVEGFVAVHQSLGEARQENEVEARLSHTFRARGTAGHAYDPIVASGRRACTLHYTHNNAELLETDCVLIDAGAKVMGYAADITRTYAKAAPSQRQKAVHAAAEQAHRQIIALLRPGLSFEAYHQSVDRIMKEALVSLNLLKSGKDYRRYFPHAVSHGLGLNVHDSLGGHTTFQPGMVLTVEPGIYIPEEAIGVRIEDDILITADGHRNLSAALPTGL